MDEDGSRIMYIMGNHGSELQHQTVIARFDTDRQLRRERVVIGLVIHVCEDRSSRAHALDPLERLREMRVRDVRPLAQAVHDPYLDASERFERARIQPNYIGRIREASDPEARAEAEPVVLPERQHLEMAYAKRLIFGDDPGTELRPIEPVPRL